MRPPELRKSDPPIKLLDKEKNSSKYYMHPLFILTIEDIFSKYDMLMNNVLSYNEFKSFYECIGRSLTPEEFQKDILDKFQSVDKTGLSGEEGLTL